MGLALHVKRVGFRDLRHQAVSEQAAIVRDGLSQAMQENLAAARAFGVTHRLVGVRPAHVKKAGAVRQPARPEAIGIGPQRIKVEQDLAPAPHTRILRPVRRIADRHIRPDHRPALGRQRPGQATRQGPGRQRMPGST